jgi:type I restriction enzyme M protein
MNEHDTTTRPPQIAVEWNYVPSLQMGDVRKLRVIVPTIEEEQAIERQHDKILKLRKQITDLEKLADELSKTAWPMSTVTMRNTDEKVD